MLHLDDGDSAFFLSDRMLIDVYCVYNDINYGDDGFIMFYWSSVISSQEDIYDHIMYHLCFRSLASNILGGLCCIAARWGIVGQYLSQMASLMRK